MKYNIFTISLKIINLNYRRWFFKITKQYCYLEYFTNADRF